MSLETIDTIDSMKFAKRIGYTTLVIFIAVFFIWSAVAPLEGAVIASGSVAVGSSRKTVQHLEGGIIKEILVKDGDVVQLNQPLIFLSGTQAKSRHESLLFHLKSEKAIEARLVAERGYSDEIDFSDPVFQGADNDPELEELMEAQRNLFDVGKQSFDQKTKILNQRIEQLKKEIEGLEFQRDSGQKQISLVKEELATVRSLLKKGLEQKPRLLALQRKEAELVGKIGEYDSLIARAQEKIGETQLNIVNLNTERLQKAANELRETQSKIADIEDNLFASQDVFDRTVITAPQAGVVTGLKFHTVGGVISPGEPIMEIVPQNEQLIVEAKLPTIDIDDVFMEQNAKIMFTAFGGRFNQRVDGLVTLISADRFQDEVSGEYYYKVNVAIQEEQVKTLGEDVELHPGMPAEVFFVTGESTFLKYLLQPLRASMRRAFSEPD